MAPKIDKEMLIKHHFWIGTGLCVVLVLFPLVYLIGGVSDAVTKERDAMVAAKKKAEGITNPKNEKWVSAYKKVDNVVEAQQMKVWRAAYESQRDFMTWPETLLQENPSFRTKQFGDPITSFELDKFSQTFKDQIGPIVLAVNPLDPGIGLSQVREPCVQFRNGWNNVLRINFTFPNMLPSREDVWLAQEDLWVKRELLTIVRAANDAVARLNEVPQQQPSQPATPAAKEAKDAKDKKEAKDDKAKETTETKDAKSGKLAKAAPKAAPAPAGDPNHKLFRNHTWEMDLRLTRGRGQKYFLSGKLTNIGKRRQPVGVFKVHLVEDAAADPAYLPIDHEPLAVGQSAPFKDIAVNEGLSISGLHGVEEVLNWRTAAVKRIDDLQLSYNASRFSRRGLVEPRWIEKGAADAVAANPAPGGGAGMGETMGKMGGMGMGMGGGSLGAAGQGGTSKNGYALKRYIDTNEQVRHMPVAMVVVVDEDFIHEFLAAFANSRLRTQTLQYHWHHFRDKIKPESENVAANEADKGGRGQGNKPQPRDVEAGMGMNMGARGGRAPMGLPGQGQMMMMMGRGGAPGMGAGAFGAGLKEDEEEAEMNLVELAVYGLASLYENPDKPATPAAGAEPAPAK